MNAASPQDAMEGILQRLSAHKMVLAIALAIVLVLILVPATCKKASSTSSTTSNYSAAYAEECPVAYRADFSQTSDPDAHGLVIQWKDRAPSAARIKVVFWDAYGDQLGTFDWSYSSAQDTSVTVTGTREASRATFYLYSVVLADSSWGTKNADDNTIANYGVKAVADLNSEAKSENYQSS